MRRILLAILVAGVGCSASGRISPQGTVTTGGSSNDLVFAPLVKGAPPDLVVASASRGLVDVYTPDGSGGWMDVGSFFAGGKVEQVGTGSVGGVTVVAGLWDSGTVVLLPANDTAAHQLKDPYQVFRRFRNGMPVDQTPPAAGMALGDLDGDGSDELIVGASGGLYLIPGTEMQKVLQALPEKPPPANGYNFPAGPQPGATAAVDVDGDGRLDAVVIDQKEPTARIYANKGGPSMLASPAVVQLPSVGKKLIVTGCKDEPFAVLLSDGTLLGVGRDGKTQPLAADLKAINTAGSTRDSVAMTFGKQTQVALYDACGSTGSGVFPNLTPLDVTALAIAPSNQPRQQALALLGSDAKTVALYALSGY